MVTKTIKYRPVLVILAMLLGLGCENKYIWDLQSVEVNTIVVDGILTNENKAQCIKISLVNPEINSRYIPFSGATVTVTDSTKTFIFTESTLEPGAYYSIPFQAVVGKTYTLNINYQTVNFSATAQMAPITPLDSLNISPENGLFKYNHTKAGNAAMTEVYLDWSLVPAYCSSYGSCFAKETFYTLYNVDINSSLGSEKETIYFPAGTQIIRRKYSLSPDHQNFLRSLLMETEWRGGIFDVQQGNVWTNLNNGALGFFGACMVLTDTTLVK